MKDKRVLIIEDEKPMAKILKMKLSRENIDADIAYNGYDGMAMLREGKYSLVILDLIMPVMDGFAVLTAMQKEKIKVPTIIASNLSQEGDAERTKELGAVDYFIKSNISLAEIVVNIKKFLK